MFRIFRNKLHRHGTITGAATASSALLNLSLAPLRKIAAVSRSTKTFSTSAPTTPENPVLAWCSTNPITFGVGFATVKTAAADVVTQTALEKKKMKDLDWRRVGLFSVFGFTYMGCFQYYLYVTLFSRWFAGATRFANQSLAKKLRDTGGQVDLMKQVAFDVCIHPIWFFPIYYTMKESLNGKPNAFEAPMSTVAGNALSKYYDNNLRGLAMADWIAFWKIWIVGDMVVYGLMPMWARLPANHFFSFVYVVVLSFMRGGNDEKDEKKKIKP